MAFYFIAAIVSTSQQVANQAFISEKIVPPIIYTRRLEDPERDYAVVTSLANFDRVLQSNKDEFRGSKLVPPNMAVKDLPDAISVTIQAAGEDQLYVSHIDYLKVTY